MKPALLIVLLLCSCAYSFAQERPQETRPAAGPERQAEIRDSIRAIGRERFKVTEQKKKTTWYEADRALLMPRMEHASIFRIGIPGWLMRTGLRMGKEDFDSEEEYQAVRALTKRIKSLRVAAYIDNPAYDRKKLLHHYDKFVKRKKGEPVMVVKAPLGGVQIHVKSRRGKVKLITLVAYGEEGAALIRLKSKIREQDLAKAVKLMTKAAKESAGVEIDTDS